MNVTFLIFFSSPSQPTAPSHSVPIGGGTAGHQVQRGAPGPGAAGERDRPGGARLRPGLGHVRRGLAVQRRLAGASGEVSYLQ